MASINMAVRDGAGEQLPASKELGETALSAPVGIIKPEQLRDSRIHRYQPQLCGVQRGRQHWHKTRVRNTAWRAARLSIKPQPVRDRLEDHLVEAALHAPIDRPRAARRS